MMEGWPGPRWSQMVPGPAKAQGSPSWRANWIQRCLTRHCSESNFLGEHSEWKQTKNSNWTESRSAVKLHAMHINMLIPWLTWVIHVIHGYLHICWPHHPIDIALILVLASNNKLHCPYRGSVGQMAQWPPCLRHHKQHPGATSCHGHRSHP